MTPMINRLDHIVFGCNDLASGTEQIELLLNTTIPPGGKHPLMGTHNCVARTSTAQFLEVIAIDPVATGISRKRWFSLDEPATHNLIKDGPRPLCWVVNTTDIDALVKHSPIELGDVIDVTRGDLHWRLTVPSDGHLPGDRLLPAFIEWPGPHPAHRMPGSGVTVTSVDLSHPDTINRLFRALSIDHLATVLPGTDSTIGFTLRTPDGQSVSVN